MSTLQFYYQIFVWRYVNGYFAEEFTYPTGNLRLNQEVKRYDFQSIAEGLTYLEDSDYQVNWVLENDTLKVTVTYDQEIDAQKLIRIIWEADPNGGEASWMDGDISLDDDHNVVPKLWQVFLIKEGEEDLEVNWRSLFEQNQEERIGLAICHGKKHKPIPEKYSSLADRWIYLDEDKDVDPDIVGDIWDEAIRQRIKEWAPNGFDVVISMRCPIEPRYTILGTFIGNLRTLIKPGGKFIMPDLAGHYSGIAFRNGVRQDFNQLEKEYKEQNPETIKFVNKLLKNYQEKLGWSSAYIDANGDGYFTN